MQAFARLRKGLQRNQNLNSCLQNMPASAGASLVSFWAGDQLLSVPDIGYHIKGYDKDVICIQPRVTANFRT